MRAFTYFLNLAKSSLIFLKFTFKLLEINLKAHYFIRKSKKSSHDNFLIASRINLKALCVLTSMIKKRMKRKVIFIEETRKQQQQGRRRSTSSSSRRGRRRRRTIQGRNKKVVDTASTRSSARLDGHRAPAPASVRGGSVFTCFD